MKNAHRQDKETNTYQTQKAFSIIWARQTPRGLVRSSVISDPAVPGLNFSAVNSLFLCHFFFLQSEDSEKFQSLSHVQQWPPHMRPCEVYSYLSGGYYKNYKPPRRLLLGITNLWPKYVLKWALGKRNLHKKIWHTAGGVLHRDKRKQLYCKRRNFRRRKFSYFSLQNLSHET